MLVPVIVMLILFMLVILVLLYCKMIAVGSSMNALNRELLDVQKELYLMKSNLEVVGSDVSKLTREARRCKPDPLL